VIPRPVVAVAAGLCLAVVTVGCTDADDTRHASHSSHETATTSASPSARSAPLADRQPRVVTLAFAGDTHFQLNLSALLDHPHDALSAIRGTLADADLTMLNLESAITERGSRDPKELEHPADRFWYRASSRALDLLAGAGVDVVTVANNHGADYGPEGLADTLRAADQGPIPVVGVGRDRAAAFTPYRATVDGTRIAFLAADASTREGRSGVWAAGPRTPGLAAARGEHTHALLRSVRSAAARDEVVVVYLHWGVEGHACPSPAQGELARAVAAAGADVVVGSHAHVQQGAGWLADTYVDYGLGNFLWYHDGVPDTGVLRVRLEDGHAVSDRWSPARIPVIGPPAPVHGRARAEAVVRWRSLRACAGLAPGPAPSNDSSHAPPAPLPAYSASVHRIGPALRHRMRSTRGPGCPVPWSDLRSLRLSYVGFDGAAHRGEIVVAADHARDVVGVFARLYDARWPIRRLRPASDYGGDDERSMAADNTSGFNCRRVSGSDHWSAHAYGAAIDVNPVENPDLHDGSVRPAAGRASARLARGAGASLPPGTIRAGDLVVDAFAAIGWEWGGTWSSPDYQHFATSHDR
jgi:poly-gamma-glutamate synthesis protein (capsule biosynthesis protein)